MTRNWWQSLTWRQIAWTQTAAKYGAMAYRDGLEMMEREKLDAVSICTSPKFRAPLMRFAAEKTHPDVYRKTMGNKP